MATVVTAFFNQGAPAAGLSPTIRIRRVDTQALEVTDDAMTEVGDGAYFYDFAALDGLVYSVRADGGNMLSSGERYTFGSIGADSGGSSSESTARLVLTQGGGG